MVLALLALGCVWHASAKVSAQPAEEESPEPADAEVAESLGYRDVETMYVAAGDGNTHPQTIVNRQVPAGDQFLFVTQKDNALAVEFVDPDAEETPAAARPLVLPVPRAPLVTCLGWAPWWG